MVIRKKLKRNKIKIEDGPNRPPYIHTHDTYTYIYIHIYTYAYSKQYWFFINKAIVPMLKEYHNFTLNISPVDISLVSF